MVEIFAREEEEEEEEEEEQKESTPTLPRDGKSNDERPSMNSREESGRKDGRMEGRKEGRGEGTLFFLPTKREKASACFFLGRGGLFFFALFSQKKGKEGRGWTILILRDKEQHRTNTHPPHILSFSLSLSPSLSFAEGARKEENASQWAEG